MAWNEFLIASDVAKEVTDEIDKDVHRLSTIAERFSKIGSNPEVQLEYLNETVEHSLQYMKSRISGKVTFPMYFTPADHGFMISPSVFQWVMGKLT